MPVIQQQNPFDVAAEAVGSYVATKRQHAVEDAARALQQRQVDAQVARDQATAQAERDRLDLDRQRAANEETHQTFEQSRELAADTRAAQEQAAAILHQSRVDALNALKERHVIDRDDKKFAQDARKIDLTYKAAMARTQATRDAAQIRATATMGAAQIHAAATVQAAGIHASATLDAAKLREQGADQRERDREQNAREMLGTRDATARRGQDLSHGDRRHSAGNVRNAQTATAVLRLSRQPGAPHPPSNDPHFAEAMRRFVAAPAAQRDAMLATPGMPADTRAYLEALSPLIAPEDDGE